MSLPFRGERPSLRIQGNRRLLFEGLRPGVQNDIRPRRGPDPWWGEILQPYLEKVLFQDRSDMTIPAAICDAVNLLGDTSLADEYWNDFIKTSLLYEVSGALPRRIRDFRDARNRVDAGESNPLAKEALTQRFPRRWYLQVAYSLPHPEELPMSCIVSVFSPRTRLF